MKLTPQQQNLFHCLEKVNPESIWGLAIHKVLSDVNEEKFDALVQQLKSQERDNPEVMREILNDTCYESLVNYKS